MDHLGVMTVQGSPDGGAYFKKPLSMMAYSPISKVHLSKAVLVGEFPVNDRENEAHRPELPM